MLNLVKWPRDPWSIFDELESLQTDMNDLLTGENNDRRSRYGRSWRRPTYPLMNVWASEEGVIVHAELPGVDPSDVDISVQGNELVLSGKVNVEDSAKEETYHRRERSTGEFRRMLQLPFRANASGIKASYKNGVLQITIPRSEEEKPKKIKIEAA